MRKHGFLMSLDIALVFYSISVSAQFIPHSPKSIGDFCQNNTNDRKAGTTGKAKKEPKNMLQVVCK
jgi:hypothetical protein